MKRNLEDLVKLDDLLKKEIITEEEFNKEKAKILNGNTRFTTSGLLGISENSYCFLIHISVLLGFVHIILGILAPIVLWVLNRDKNEAVDRHGKHVLNWILSFALYLSICLIIVFPLSRIMHWRITVSYDLSSPISLFSGFFPISALMILNIIFVLVGALKASSGASWKYPLSIRFLR